MKLWARNKKQKTVASISVRSQDKSGYHSLHYAVRPRTSALRETTPVKRNTQRRHQQQHLTNINVTIDTKCATTCKPHWGEIISRSQTTQQYPEGGKVENTLASVQSFQSYSCTRRTLGWRLYIHFSFVEGLGDPSINRAVRTTSCLNAISFYASLSGKSSEWRRYSWKNQNLLS